MNMASNISMNPNCSDYDSPDEDKIMENLDLDTKVNVIICRETLTKKSADRYLLVYETYKK